MASSPDSPAFILHAAHASVTSARFVTIGTPTSKKSGSDCDNMANCRLNRATSERSLNQRHSISRGSSRAHSTHHHTPGNSIDISAYAWSSRPPALPRKYAPRDLREDNNRENMKALAEFLRTQAPPVGNFVSDPDVDWRNPAKKTQLKQLFRRQSYNRVKESPPQPPPLIQLPDTAVAAKTTGGYRYIAISIPKEFDHLQVPSPTGDGPSSTPDLDPASPPADSFDRKLNVLEPLKEVPTPTEPRFQRVGAQETSRPTSAIDIVGPETAEALEQYYTQTNQRTSTSVRSLGDAQSVKSISTTRGSVRSPVVVLPPDNIHQSNPRYSTTSMYSTASNFTHPTHSRGVSDASTPSSVSSSPAIKLAPPPRRSSRSGRQIIFPAPFDPTIPLEDASAPKVTSGGSDRLKEDPILPHGVYSARPPGSAPTCELPKVPSKKRISNTRPSTAPAPAQSTGRSIPRVNTSNSQALAAKRPVSAVEPTAEVIVAKHTAQTQSSRSKSRQEAKEVITGRQARVKARKQRDVAALQKQKVTRVGSSKMENGPTAPNAPPSPPTTPMHTTANSPNRQSVTDESLQEDSPCSFSPIMLVAEVTPAAVELPDPSEFARLIDRFTPPPHSPMPKSRSAISIQSSSSDTLSRHISSTYTTNHYSDDPLSQRLSFVESSTRSARSSRRVIIDDESFADLHTSAAEYELDARIAKIERDTSILLGALGNFAHTFGSLHGLLPQDDWEEPSPMRGRSMSDPSIGMISSHMLTREHFGE